jgi:hypothetical protein
VHLEIDFTSGVGASSSNTSVVLFLFGDKKVCERSFKRSDPIFTSKRFFG